MLKREDFINRFAAKGYTKKASVLILDDFTDVISEILVDGESLMLHGFGTFCVKDRKSRVSNDPQTHEPIVLPASRLPVFIAGKTLKRAVREGIIRE